MIKPCPLCGKPAVVRGRGYMGHLGWVDWFTVGCTDYPKEKDGKWTNGFCGIWLAASTEAEAIARWNKRTKEAK